MKKIISRLGFTILYVYILPITFFMPYYNWQYAKDNGFTKWLLLGEVVATGKSLVWPYFLFFYEKNEPSANMGEPNSSSSSEMPEFNASELDIFSQVMQKCNNDTLTQEDINKLRNVMIHYTNRTGKKMSNEEYHSLVDVTKITDDYLYELGTSLLYSWDQKEIITTSKFDYLYKIMKSQNLRKEVKLQEDINTLKAASINQPYIEDELGQRYEFGREVILQHMRQNELIDLNLQKVVNLMKEFVE